MPFWNQHDEFGDTNLLVVKPEEGASLARALGPHAAVLMNNHGATVVGRDLRELVSRAIFMCQNAEYQFRAHLLGKVATLTPGETRLASTLNALPNVTNRTWEYWTLRLAKAGGLPRARRPAESASAGRIGQAPASRTKAGGRKTSQRKKPPAGRRKGNPDEQEQARLCRNAGCARAPLAAGAVLPGQGQDRRCRQLKFIDAPLSKERLAELIQIPPRAK